ncbi:MAG: ABC transporter ATP-binding protein [Actinobacteria bacterium]|nr:MAG: ABC transporter ATP-binding protein [Actinomycetota bacterium]
MIDALVGFHPDLTGRENVYLLSSMHGLGRRAVANKIDHIFEFAEITDLAETPLKRYSAGMAARLGFATIANLEMDVLLIDEILAVGDAAFQRKCIDWLSEFQSSGGTLMFVSHNLSLVRNMTKQILWLDHGRVVREGATTAVLADYARAMESRESDAIGAKRLDQFKALRTRGAYRWLRRIRRRGDGLLRGAHRRRRP